MSRSERILLAAGGSAAILALAAGWVLLSPPAGGAALQDDGATLIGSFTPQSATTAPSGTPEPATIVVDVEGAVIEPGIRTLPSGARVADALLAAGGYAPDADLEAAAETLNLAERLSDGAQILVPRVGAGVVAAAPSGAAPAPGTPGDQAGPGGTVNLNTASAEQLDALPGIGPVTVDRIIAARAEQPFSSLEDALERGVLDRGQLRELEGLATAG